MNIDNASLVAQLIESIQSAVKELEKAVNRNNADGISKTKEEILKFQRQISELL